MLQAWRRENPEKVALMEEAGKYLSNVVDAKLIKALGGE